MSSITFGLTDSYLNCLWHAQPVSNSNKWPAISRGQTTPKDTGVSRQGSNPQHSNSSRIHLQDHLDLDGSVIIIDKQGKSSENLQIMSCCTASNQSRITNHEQQQQQFNSLIGWRPFHT
jgi:hypothetical protein